MTKLSGSDNSIGDRSFLGNSTASTTASGLSPASSARSLGLSPASTALSSGLSGDLKSSMSLISYAYFKKGSLQDLLYTSSASAPIPFAAYGTLDEEDFPNLIEGDGGLSDDPVDDILPNHPHRVEERDASAGLLGMSSNGLMDCERSVSLDQGLSLSSVDENQFRVCDSDVRKEVQWSRRSGPGSHDQEMPTTTMHGGHQSPDHPALPMIEKPTEMPMLPQEPILNGVTAAQLFSGGQNQRRNDVRPATLVHGSQQVPIRPALGSVVPLPQDDLRPSLCPFSSALPPSPVTCLPSFHPSSTPRPSVVPVRPAAPHSQQIYYSHIDASLSPGPVLSECPLTQQHNRNITVVGSTVSTTGYKFFPENQQHNTLSGEILGPLSRATPYHHQDHNQNHHQSYHQNYFQNQHPTHFQTHQQKHHPHVPSVAPLTNERLWTIAAEAARSTATHLSPVELNETLQRSKELTRSAITKLHVACASVRPLLHQAESTAAGDYGLSSDAMRQLQLHLSQLLTDAIGGMAAALLCLSPEYFEGIVDHKQVIDHGPLRIAHPDEFKNSSSFLKVYGDPQCHTHNGVPPPLPRKGRNGNWECPKCQNINYPRRYRCNNPTCRSPRGAEGDLLVNEYARRVFHHKQQHMALYQPTHCKGKGQQPFHNEFYNGGLNE